jgi:flagellar motor protein MotB
MMKHSIVAIMMGFFLLAHAPGLLAETISEHIHFLQEDGEHSMRYYTIRSDSSSYKVHFWKQKGITPEDHLQEFLYIYPNQYQWDTVSDNASDVLVFPQGSYAMMDWEPMDELLSIADGIYTYSSWNGKKRPDGHYGYWNTPDNYDQFVYSWVMPKNFELVSWEANRPGEWVRRYNTLSYYGHDVNDLVFTIRYRLRRSETFEKLKKQLAEYKAVIVDQQNQGIRLTLGATILFPSGGADLSRQGRDLLRQVALALRDNPGLSLSVNGFTDNRPIHGALKKRFDTNWELSSERALTVLHYLVKEGYPEKQIEARAYGERYPRASNATPEGRALNRRIELLIFPSSSLSSDMPYTSRTSP